jgi:hypothetical protein
MPGLCAGQYIQAIMFGYIGWHTEPDNIWRETSKMTNCIKCGMEMGNGDSDVMDICEVCEDVELIELNKQLEKYDSVIDYFEDNQ